MKTAIVYATKYGCTKKCAEILKTYLHGEVNILSVKADKINLSQYDTVFIGGSVYMGKIQKEITHFCKRNLKQLLHKKIAYGNLCGAPQIRAPRAPFQKIQQNRAPQEARKKP